MRRIAFRLLILALSLSCLALTPAPIKPTTIKGKVTDLKTKKPLSGVTVKLSSRSGKAYATAITNAKGSYQISLRLSNRLGEICRLAASKQGYASKAIQSFLRPAKSYAFNFKLKAITQTNHPPSITSIAPEDSSTFLAGASVNIQISASDPDNDPLEYQISIGGSVKKPYSSQNFFLWQTSSADTGSISILCETKDPKGLTASKTISLSIINPTVEEILNRVVDNYALVDDKKMDVTMTSKFGNETGPFGDTIYTRHYFKKPDKQRTETFSDPMRIESSLTEIHLVSGPDSYLIDPVSGAKAHMNIMEDEGLTQEQLNQMDEIYHLSSFLSAHTITRSDTPEDLANGLVTLEIIPNLGYIPYSKLIFQIDYFKGLKVKYLIYLTEDGQDRLIQQIITTSTQQMPNGAWVAQKEEKTGYFKAGNLVTTHEFSNIEINTSLSEDLFKPAAE